MDLSPEKIKMKIKTRIVLLPMIAVIALISGCPHTPNAELAEARQAMIDIKAVQVTGECLDFLNQAQKHLKKAEEFEAAGENDEAVYEAQKARHLVDKARRCQQFNDLRSEKSN